MLTNSLTFWMNAGQQRLAVAAELAKENEQKKKKETNNACSIAR